MTKAKAKEAAKGMGRPIVSVRVASQLNERIAALAKAEGIEVAEWLSGSVAGRGQIGRNGQPHGEVVHTLSTLC